MATLVESTAEKNIRDILTLAIGHSERQSAVIVYDEQSLLSRTLTQAYRRSLPEATTIEFDKVDPAEILPAFEKLKPFDLVVLIQSTSFRLGVFRIRVDLFSRGIKVIEHPHLSTMADTEIPTYLDSLAYDPEYFRGVGHKLKHRVDHCRGAVIDSGGEKLIYSGGFESAKLNVGDYDGTKNVGGQFPIGEVFTEAKQLEAVEGRVRLFAFGNTSFQVERPEKPITLVIRAGRVAEVLDATPEFDRVMDKIRSDEGEVWIRELGFGLNRALTPERILSDVGAYERMCGIHLSLGAKHSVYKKPQFTRSQAKHHVDVFVAVETVSLDGEIVFKEGGYVL